MHDVDLHVHQPRAELDLCIKTNCDLGCKIAYSFSGFVVDVEYSDGGVPGAGDDETAVWVPAHAVKRRLVLVQVVVELARSVTALTNDV